MKLDLHTGHTSLLDVVFIALLGAVIAIHTAGLTDQVSSSLYLGVGYVLLIVTSFVSMILVGQRDQRGWLLAGLIGLVNAVGFVLSRTTGLPHAHGDIGNWSETLGQWSLAADVALIVLAIVALWRHRRDKRLNP